MSNDRLPVIWSVARSQSAYTLGTEIGFKEMQVNVYAIRWPKDIHLQHDLFKFVDLRLFVTEGACHKRRI